MRRAVLMCAGEYEPIPIPVGRENKSLRSAEAFADEPFVVSVDGGLPRLLDQGISPDLVLGDFDSLDKKYHPYLEEFGSRYPDRLLRLPCEKDDTDTVYAARVCLERGCRELLFYGALGGRLDHTFANIQMLAWLKKEGADGYLIGKTTLAAVVSAEKVILPARYEGTFSLFALDEKVEGVTLEGMKYPLSEAVVTSCFPIGVSNEIHPETTENVTGGCACVTVRSGLALIILETSAGTGEDAGEGKRWGIPDPSEIIRMPL